MASTYTKIFNCLEKLPRATDPSKKLPLNTRKLAGYLFAKMQKSTTKVICIDFEVIMKIVETGERQARRIINQLKGTLFNIEYKKAARINNRFVQHKMVISLTIEGRKVLGDLQGSNPGDQNVRALNKKENKTIINNRSISNFKKDDLSKKVLKLSDFADPTEKDCETLRKLSGRSFSSNAIKEIIKDMAKRLGHVYFNCKAGFIAYMAQALRNEMRDEVKTSNTNFRIKANITDEDRKAIEIEKYLTEIENIREVSQEVHLKKKLASVLKPLTAYNLLKNYRDIKVIGSIAQIKLRKHVELTELEENLVLNQVKATHEILIDGMFETIEKINFIMPTNNLDKNNISTPPRIGVWGKLRTEIVNLLGEAGENLDKSLFSKFDAEIDENNKQIKLKAKSSFYKKFIEERYSQVMQITARNNGYSIYDISC